MAAVRRQQGVVCGSTAAAQRQLSGSDEWGGRVAGHWQQRLQQSGGGGVCTRAAAAVQRQGQGSGGGTVAIGRC
jgi:hypothetical protein